MASTDLNVICLVALLITTAVVIGQADDCPPEVCQCPYCPSGERLVPVCPVNQEGRHCQMGAPDNVCGSNARLYIRYCEAEDAACYTPDLYYVTRRFIVEGISYDTENGSIPFIACAPQFS